MKRRLALSLVFLLTIASLSVGQRRAARPGVKPAGLATQCDQLAAHPNDPEATAKGVSEANLNASAVITACEAETSIDSNSPRLTFQLARGYLKAGRVEEAIEQLVRAAEGGHGGALAYLGDIYLDGAAGLEADPVLAHSLYQRAAEAGFAPAKAILAKFEDFTERAAAADVAESEPTSAVNANTKYINPDIVENILKGDLDAVPYGEIYTKVYLVNMAENISEVCNDHFTKQEITSLKQDAALKSVDVSPDTGLTNLMGILMNMGRMTQDPGALVREQSQAQIDQDNLPEDAMKDAFALMNRHTCGSRQLSQFSKNLVSYIRNEDAPLMTTNKMYGVCQREARPMGRYDARNFCICFMGAMSQTGVSRADRKGLATDFWSTAQKMMAKKPDHYAMCAQ